MKPHQRKQERGKGEESKTAHIENPAHPVFFYMPREHPYGVFCQWKSTKFTVPVSSLSWIKLAHPANKSTTPTPEYEAGTLEFNCAEQFMMYGKALFFSDEKSGGLIMASEDPKEQKKLGRQVQGWDEYLWRRVCERVVFEGNWWKFSQNEAYRNILMGTGERELCEASRADRLWGIGYNAKEAMQYKRLWGENLLGKTLVRVRESVKARVEEHERYERTDWDLPSTDMWERLRREQEEKVKRDIAKGKKS
jgi:ribA/ribD-fused uncharacterized protein